MRRRLLRGVRATLAMLAGVLVASPLAAQQPAPMPMPRTTVTNTACRAPETRAPVPAPDGSATTERAWLAREMGDVNVSGGLVHLKVRRSLGWLGLRTSESSALRFTSEGRVMRYCDYPVVVSVEPASPAERAGLGAGDTIVAYNGQDLVRTREIALDRMLVPGDTLRVSVRRGGRLEVRPVIVGHMREVTFVRPPSAQGSWVLLPPAPPAPETMRLRTGPGTLVRTPRAPRPPDAPMTPGVSPAPPAMPAMPPVSSLDLNFGMSAQLMVAGAQVVAMDDDLRDAMRAGDGLLVLRVLPGSPAAEAGLRAGDVIRTADGRTMTSPAVLYRTLLTSARGDGERGVPLEVERKGKRRAVGLRW